MKLSIKNILDFLDSNHIEYKYSGDNELSIENFCSLNHPKNNSIFWVRKVENYDSDNMACYEKMLMIIDTEKVLTGINYINCKNPRGVFFSIINNFWSTERKAKIEKTSVVETDRLGENVYIGHHCYINKDVTIGNNVTIMHNVTIMCPTTIKDDTIIHSGVVIGADGFGYYQDEAGINQKIEHYGGVQIGRKVEVGANTCIDRGTIDDTVIDDNTKIDDLCLIGHNVQIGKNVLIIGNTTVAGSTTIHDNAYISLSTTIMNQLAVGKDSYIGMGAVVLQNVEDEQKVFGNPARAMRKN